MNIARSALISIALALTMFVPVSPVFPETLTCGGVVAPAQDQTTADGGNWTVYNPANPFASAAGIAGQFAPGYWAGEVAAHLDGVNVGDELICFIEKETDGGTLNHKGYYAVMDHQLGTNDPVLFEPCTLREIPAPDAALSGGDVFLTWNHALEDSYLANIAGYNVFRSMNGTTFTKINNAPLAVNTYTDFQVPVGTRYYAVGLAYSGTLSVDGAIISHHVQIYVPVAGDIDSDGDVDGRDLFRLADKFGSVGCDGCPESLNGDNSVNEEDLALMSEVFGKEE